MFFTHTKLAFSNSFVLYIVFKNLCFVGGLVLIVELTVEKSCVFKFLQLSAGAALLYDHETVVIQHI